MKASNMRYHQHWRGGTAPDGSASEATGALGWLRDAATHLPVLQLPAQRKDIDQIEQIARDIRRQSKGLLVLGTGGSSLGAQTLCALSNDPFPICFCDNMDPHTLEQFLQREDCAQWHVLAISKSGTTVETITQLLLCLSVLESAWGVDGMAQRVHVITEPGERPLRTLAQQYGISVLDHEPNLGGRYSVLSAVGLLPAAVAGLDIAALRAGAGEVMQSCLHDASPAPLGGALWQAAYMSTHPLSVLMPYCDRLSVLGAWYRQLWAESLGKQGKGSTPIRAVGATDQHSQLQLYLDGPKDKIFTLITLPHAGHGPRIDTRGMAGFEYLHGRRSGEVMASLQHGTIETLTRHKLPLRILELQRLDEHTLGALLMHYMIETMLCARLIGVDAFDQPAVEQGKQLARDYLLQGEAA